jgi:serine/threonine protein kinase
LLARLGAGGMGVVYLGTARRGPATSNVAIKVLRPELADDADFRARFRREVLALSRVRGLCTVRVLEADVDCERPYLVTEYVAGPTLAEWVTEHGPLSSGMLHGLAAGLAEALAAIHAAGVVHRDLKPGNVLLAADGPRVIDFGIAQTLDATSVTRTGMSVGSPGFMAPEQVRGKSGPAADIFAWGLTIGYAASGQPPFGTGPPDAIFYRILHDDPDIEAVPATLQPLVTAALAKAPEDRPTAAELLAPPLMAAPEAGVVGPQAVAADSPGSALRAMLSRTWLVPVSSRPDVTLARRSRRRSLAARSPFLVPVAAALVSLLGGLLVLAVGAARHAEVAAFPATPAYPCSSLGCTGSTVYQGVPSAEPTWASPGPPSMVPSIGPTTTTSLPVSRIPVSPFGPCQTSCPSFVPAPSVQVSGDATSDGLWLEQQGYAPLANGPQWGDAWWILNVIVARTQGGLRAFFFDDGILIGYDVPDGDGSTGLQAFRLADNEIDIRYQLHGTSASVADVRFQLTGNQLVTLDPMPPWQVRN